MRRVRRLVAVLAVAGLAAAGVLSASLLDVSWGPVSSAAPAPGATQPPTPPPPTASQVADARQLGRTFAQVAAQISPSVVRISVTKPVKGLSAWSASPSSDPFGDPFERFFGLRRGKPMKPDAVRGRRPRVMGFIVVACFRRNLGATGGDEPHRDRQHGPRRGR